MEPRLNFLNEIQKVLAVTWFHENKTLKHVKIIFLNFILTWNPNHGLSAAS